MASAESRGTTFDENGRPAAECPVCFRRLQEPAVVICSSGHAVCRRCSDALTYAATLKCPVAGCGEKLRSLAAAADTHDQLQASSLSLELASQAPPVQHTASASSSSAALNNDQLCALGDPRLWTEDDVATWIRQLGKVSKFVDHFEFTNGRALLELSEADLKEMGIEPHGARQRLMVDINSLKRAHASDHFRAHSDSASPAHPRVTPGPLLFGDLASSSSSAADGKRWDAFVSYAHKDQDKVLRYVTLMEHAGISVWIDRELRAGRPWMPEIAQAMVNSWAFVVFLSPAYFDSRNCDDEFQYAHHVLRMPKYPVWLKPPASCTKYQQLRDYHMMLTKEGWTVQKDDRDASVEEAAAFLIRGLVENLRLSQAAAASSQAQMHDSSASASAATVAQELLLVFRAQAARATLDCRSDEKMLEVLSRAKEALGCAVLTPQNIRLVRRGERSYPHICYEIVRHQASQTVAQAGLQTGCEIFVSVQIESKDQPSQSAEPEPASIPASAPTLQSETLECSSSLAVVRLEPVEEFVPVDGEDPDVALSRLAKARRWQRCPQCRMYIINDGGCNHMRCTCGTEFCYTCGEGFSSSHDGCWEGNTAQCRHWSHHFSAAHPLFTEAVLMRMQDLA
eukprot:tig00021348_g20536.t1